MSRASRSPAPHAGSSVSERKGDTRLSSLQDLLAADERAEALVLLAAGRAADQMGPQAGDRGVGVGARELELDVAVELLEALVAADLGLGRAEQPAKRLLEIRSLHHVLSSRS